MAADDPRSGRRVKGKQVKILHDLVTVMEERYAIRKGAISRAASLSNREGCHTAWIPESGNLPFLLVQNPLRGIQITRY
jgi:hypothetical protein